MSVEIYTPSPQQRGTPNVSLTAFEPRAAGHYQPPRHTDSREQRGMDIALAQVEMMNSFPDTGHLSQFKEFFYGLTSPEEMRRDEHRQIMKSGATQMDLPNRIAKLLRDNARHYQTVAPGRGGPLELSHAADTIAKSGAIAKATLDVGSQTNFTQITGGQSLGYVSLDTRIARSTVRPDSFTLYQALPKSPAFQIVDYWATVDDTGGPLPGSAFSGFSNVASGTLATDAGIYGLSNVNLKLGLDGRAVTTALMAQNSFVDVVTQENANAALTVLASQDWVCYWGNPAVWPNQPVGLYHTVPSANIFDYGAFYAANASVQGWSSAQTLYNMIYEVAAQVTSWGRFGRITHAFMTPITNGSLQSLVTTTLNNIVTAITREQRDLPGIIVDGDLQGMRTRMGVIQFPLDLTITAREIPAQGQPRSNGTTPTITTVTPPSTVTVAVSGSASTGTNWGTSAGAYVAASGKYAYAVASTDVNMNESTLTWSTVASGVTATGAYVLTITPADSTAFAFRVFRTGLGGFAGTSNSPTAVRGIGSVVASGGSAVTFIDQNLVIPGSESIFMLDLHEADDAFDYRFLLPLTRVELFAQNLYMPWAVATIAAPRIRIPKFHAIIKNYVPDSPVWNPLGTNV